MKTSNLCQIIREVGMTIEDCREDRGGGKEKHILRI